MGRGKTHEQYVEELNREKDGQFSVLEKYNGARNSIRHKHNTCGYEWDVAPTNILKRQGCPKCSGKVNRTESQYKEELLKWFNGDLELLEPYEVGKRKVGIKHKHVSCGYEWIVTPMAIWNARNNEKTPCPRCNGGALKTHEQYLKDLERVHHGKILLLEQYGGNNKDSLLHKCVKCSHEWKARPANILFKKGCPKCNQSHGEREIENFLVKHGISYETQFRMEGCKLKRELPFDFAILKGDGSLDLLIEFDGEQHFRAKERFGGEEYLKKTQLRDQIKNEYCLQNNIKLIRIPYWEFDQIEQVLERELGLLTA